VPPTTIIANAVVLFGLLLVSSACKPSAPPPNVEPPQSPNVEPPQSPNVEPPQSPTVEPPQSPIVEPPPPSVEPPPPSPGTPLDPITVPERLDSERNQRPSTFALGWLGATADGVPSWPAGSDWSHILLDSEGTPLHLGLSPELVIDTAGATGDLLLTVDGPAQALAITSRFASSWSAKAAAHVRPSAGTLRCPAEVEGFNLERGDTDCFDEQGGGWFSLAVTCPVGRDYARFYVNVNPVLQRAEVALKSSAGAGRVAAVFAEAWSKP
jgi:hypothetical protein